MNVGDITVNATIVVQMLNFWIAYLLLRTLLFKPVYRAIMTQEKTEKGLREAITVAQGSINQSKQEQRTLWQKCHAYFEKNRPRTQMGYTTVSKIPPIEAPIISTAQRTRLAEEAYKEIIKQLEIGSG